MPVLLEGTAVVIHNEALERCLDGGADSFYQIAPNSMSFGDGYLCQASFMSSRDAELFREKLALMGLRTSGDAPEVVMVDAHQRTVNPHCDWLQLMQYKENLIARLVGVDSDVVVAPESWNPDSGPTLQHISADEVQQRLEFVRREKNVDVYRDKESGKLLYSARLHETESEMFQKAADTVLKHMRRPGDPAPSEEVQEEIRQAIGTLQRLASRRDDAWRVWFLLGKAWHAVDRIARAIAALEKASQLCDPAEVVIYKELSGVLLEIGETRRGCETGEKAVALKPEDVELLGNLSIAYMMDNRLAQARKTLDHALAVDPGDETNRFIDDRLQAIGEGRMPIPKTLAELQGKPSPSAVSSIPQPSSKSWFQRLMNRRAKP